MTPFNNSTNTAGSKGSEGGSEKSKDDEKKEEDESTADPETAASYIIHLLPLFIKSYQTSMVSSVKKAILGLTRKMIFYSTGENLQELAKTPGFASGLVEVIAAVFENEVESSAKYSVQKAWRTRELSAEQKLLVPLSLFQNHPQRSLRIVLK